MGLKINRKEANVFDPHCCYGELSYFPLTAVSFEIIGNYSYAVSRGIHKNITKITLLLHSISHQTFQTKNI